jgi:hypothetical protein
VADAGASIDSHFAAELHDSRSAIEGVEFVGQIRELAIEGFCGLVLAEIGVAAALGIARIGYCENCDAAFDDRSLPFEVDLERAPAVVALPKC